MKLSIQDLDNMLETFFESNLLSLFNKNPLILLTEELINVFEKNIRVINGKKIVPNVFSVFIRDQDQFSKNDLKEWEPFAKQLITEVSEDNSYSLSGPLNVKIIFDGTIDKNFEITVKKSDFISGDTINLSSKFAEAAETVKDVGAFLILWNEEIFEITKNITSIGRQTDNDLVIDNLRVSRIHAQIRRIKNSLYIFDTDSTTGINVNGQIIKRHQLSNGDVIEIADVPLIFSIGEKPEEINHQASRTKILKTKEMRDTK